jgi:hypothetical protein
MGPKALDGGEPTGYGARLAEQRATAGAVAKLRLPRGSPGLQDSQVCPALGNTQPACEPDCDIF